MSKEKLEFWQKRVNDNETLYADEFSKMDKREELYRGTHTIRQVIENQKVFKTFHLRNVCAELIEAQVDTALPMPKVTARRPGDEKKAKLIEDMLRSELDRQPFEEKNDILARTVPIQGGAAFLCEWDNTSRTHTTVGELNISTIHPKQIIPQEGITSDIEDMDYIILRTPQSKGYIKRRYGVDVSEESEENPEARGKDVSAATDIVTLYTAYYRNENGGIGRYSWVNDTELEDLDDYQARRLSRCTVCGEVEPSDTKICSCGNTVFKEQNEDYIDIIETVFRTGEKEPIALQGEKVPAYKPDIYPVILIKNVSLFGSFLGGSDLDQIEDQQNTINRIEQKMLDKVIKAGSYLSLPDEAIISEDENEMKVIRLGSPSDLEMIRVFTTQGDISQDMAFLAQAYEEARQMTGVTDSFQGRPDRTATSGKAKQIAAAQSAGRFASKRTMKDSAYARLFEAMFKFVLAYADEPRYIISRDSKGLPTYISFNKWDFLEKDANGEFYWNDQFLFSCETTTPLASNREAMWQETRMNFESGTFGNPGEYSTLILFWTKMEELHYPGAAETKSWLEEKQQQQLMQTQAQMQVQHSPMNMSAEQAVI